MNTKIQSSLTNNELLEEYIKPYSDGSSLHYSLTQPILDYFVTKDGLIAYKKKFGKLLVLGDPIFSNQLNDSKLAFIKAFFAKFPSPVFVQTSKEFSSWLHEQYDFYATPIGLERTINLQIWSKKGKRKQTIRTAYNQSIKRDISIRENPQEDNFESVSKNWLSTRTVKSKEIQFLVRSFPHFEAETRKFCAYDANNSLIAFIIFDPLYRNGKCIGYIPNISRSSEHFKQGLFYAIMVHAICCFAEEGKEILNLGLAPLELKDDLSGMESKVFMKLLKKIRRFTAGIYNYGGIEYTKSRFLNLQDNAAEGYEKTMYLCHKDKLPLIELTAIFKASNVI